MWLLFGKAPADLSANGFCFVVCVLFVLGLRLTRFSRRDVVVVYFGSP